MFQFEIYEELLAFSIQHRKETGYLGTLAHCLVLSKPVPPPIEVDQHLIEELVNFSPVQAFKKTPHLFFFIALHLLEENRKDADFHIVRLLLKLQNNETLRANISVQLMLILGNRIHNISILEQLLNFKQPITSWVKHGYWEALPYIGYDEQHLIPAITMLTNGVRASSNYIMLNEAIRKLCFNNPVSGDQIINHFKEDEQQALLLIPHAFLGIRDAKGIPHSFPYTQKLLRSSKEYLRLIGVQCLYSLHGDQDDLTVFAKEIDQVLYQLFEQAVADIDAAIITFYGLLFGKYPSAEYHFFHLLSVRINDRLRFVVVQQLMRWVGDQWDKPYFAQGLQLVTHF